MVGERPDIRRRAIVSFLARRLEQERKVGRLKGDSYLRGDEIGTREYASASRGAPGGRDGEMREHPGREILSRSFGSSF